MATFNAPASAIEVRLALEEDSRWIFSWRNDPVTREMSHTHEPISWDDHRVWFEEALKNPARCLLMCSNAKRRVAVTRFDLFTHEALVSINLDPDLRGQGLGKVSLEAAIAYFNALQVKSYDLLAEIKRHNLPSRRVFEACEFTLEREDQATAYYRRLTRDRADRTGF